MSLPPSFEIMLVIFLVAAVFSDMNDHRIPNAITFAAAATGFFGNLYLGGLEGAGLALGGLALGMLFLLPFYILGGMGAGDVKMMGAIGAFLGPHATLLAVGVALVCGAIGAVVLLLVNNIRQHRQHNFAASHTHTVAQAMKMRFPYALALASGAMAALVYLKL